MNKAYQCSQCANLEDMDEYVICTVGIDPRPNHREKGDAKKCRENFKPAERVWHEKFSWEQVE